MNSKSAKIRIPAVMLLVLCTALAFLIANILALESKTEASVDVILPAAATDAVLRTAVPATPTPAPTLAPLLADTGSETTPPPYPFWSEGMLFTGDSYRSPTLSVDVTVTNDAKTFGRRVIYYVADVRVADVTQIRTEAYTGDFARARHGDVEKMAWRVDALIAISGDYCGFRKDSLIIRNGEVYRTMHNKNDDVCLLLRDGEMKTIPAAKVDMDAILDMDPWQAWEFGPSLLDANGRAYASFRDSYISPRNPRCCLGYMEPGHYCFVVVDGRQAVSHGLTLVELAQLMESLGCRAAYNLDGGASAHMYWKNDILNSPSGGGREMSDIIYIAKEPYPASRFFCGKEGRSE